jgi:hypothetical protein
MKLLDILLEEDKKKQSLKQTFHTNYCEFLIKFEKKINKTQAIERIRGIKTVTVVENVPNSKIELINKNLKDYEYSLLGVKFITNQDVKKQIERISYEMAKGNREKGVFNIKGIVSAKPRLDTLKKID